MESRQAFVVDALRTPTGKRGGNLSGWHPVDLAAETLSALVQRTKLDPSLVEDVVMGCVTQVGAQSFNVGRNAVLAAGWPFEVPSTTVDRQCGSSLQAIQFAAHGVLAGGYDVVVAAGVECMSTVPMFSALDANLRDPYGDLVRQRLEGRASYGDLGIIEQGLSAEFVAEKWALSREALDEFGLLSQVRAALAQDEGRFDAEIHPVVAKIRDPENPVTINLGPLVSSDQGIRDTSLEALAKLRPAFTPTGRITAGNSSQIADGAAAVLVASEKAVAGLGLHPRARILDCVVVGSDPIEMLTGPIPATARLFERTGIDIDLVDLFEVNEAFAPVVLAWAKEFNVSLDRVNVNGGAIALGHPLGASGARLMATLIHELERRRGKYGVVVICEGGGMANAILVERVA